MPWQRVIGPPESEKTATSSLASSCQLKDGDLARVRVAEEGDDDVEQAQLPVHRVPELGRVVEHDGGLEEEGGDVWQLSSNLANFKRSVLQFQGTEIKHCQRHYGPRR